MENLRFSIEELEGLKQKELMRFISSLVGYQSVKNQRVSIGVFSRVKGEKNSNMETLKIYFQSWVYGQSGAGTHHVWTSWQAIDGGCSQSSFEQKKWNKIITKELQKK